MIQIIFKTVTLTFPSSEPREVQINFQSDASGSGRGFHIEYVQVFHKGL